ncbi:MAG: RNA polymerase sigma factor [Pseudonocardiaceae bacterium]
MDEGQESQSADAPEPRQETTSARWVRIWARRELLIRVARRYGSLAEDAEDTVQEAMLRAAEHPEITDDRLQAWLCAVTMRLCMDGHRRRAAEARRWERASALAMVQQPGQYVEEEVCERSEAAWMAAQAAELLPPRQIQALRLTAAGCTVQQVASHLGVRLRAAESLLARARRTLRTVLIASLSAGVERPCTGISDLAPPRQRAACPARHDLPATATNTTTAGTEHPRDNRSCWWRHRSSIGATDLPVGAC